MTISASRVARLLRCPGSAALPQIGHTSDAAVRGTAVHRYLEDAMRGGDPSAALDAVSDEYRDLCAAIDLARLPSGLEPELAIAFDVATGKARRLGSGIGRQYGVLGASEIVMTLDVAGVSEDAAYVCDYKATMRSPGAAASNEQLRVCALGLARLYGKERAVTALAHVRPDGSTWIDQAELDCLDLAAVAVEVRDLVSRVAEQQARAARGEPLDLYEGSWCSFCPAFAACPAKARLAVQVAEGRLLDGPEALLPLTPERAGVAWDKLKAARALLAHVERAVMATLDEAGGALPLPGGRQLVKRQAPGNEALVGAVAFQVVAEAHGVEVAARAVEMRATKAGLRDALRPLCTKHGELGRAEKAVLDELRARGGASRAMRTVVEEVEAPAQGAAG